VIEPLIEHHFGGGVYAKETRIPAGFILVQHKHTFDHLSIVGSGIVQVTSDGVTSTVTAPACLTIKAGTEHRVHAITDAVWYCVHATDCTDPEKVDELLIERG
jgi:quercetin dioxygenase-like cupin family protein